MLRRLSLIALALTSTVLAQPATLKGFRDQGAFRLYVNEESIAILTFDWKDTGEFHSEAVITVAGQSIRNTLDIEVDKAGVWTAMRQQTPLGPVVITQSTGQAARTFKDKTTTTFVKDGSVVLDNYSPALLRQTLRKYDAAQGGKQKIAIFVSSGSPIDPELEKNNDVERSVASKDIRFSRYTLHTSTADLIVWADPEGKICLLAVPAQKAAFVREGYEALLKTEADPTISAAKFEVKAESNVKIPMRDGVALAADVYRPVTEEKVPIILVRTPYKKELNELQGRYYARRGYAYVVQDCRGRFSSPGAWEPFLHEDKDGYDTIEHLAKMPWSNARVGMIGASYLGWVQWWAAALKPPHLVTIIPNVAPPDPFYNMPYEYGVFFLTGAIWWADIVQSNATADISGGAFADINDKKLVSLLQALPVIDLDKAVFGKENPYWREWIKHPVDDDFWAPANFLDKLKGLNLPVFHQSGWFDGDGIGSKLNYAAMKNGGASNQKLVLGPWGHTDTSARTFGGRDFGPAALMDLQMLYLRWFDHHLKGVDNGIMKEPLVSIFVMGSNKWLTGDTYPLASTKFDKWYLNADGKLNREAPGGDPQTYVYDPGDPTPDWRMFEDPEEDTKKVREAGEGKKKAQEYEKKILAERKDILVFQTDVFKTPYTFAGPVSAMLYASSSAKDTDFFVRLVEVDKDGKSFHLGLGKVRARYRNTTHKAEFLKPGEIYEYKIDVWQTGIRIPAGSRLRVEVSSAVFPMFSRNLNTGGHNEMDTKFVSAKQTIYHDARHPSHLLLPGQPE